MHLAGMTTWRPSTRFSRRPPTPGTVPGRAAALPDALFTTTTAGLLDATCAWVSGVRWVAIARSHMSAMSRAACLQRPSPDGDGRFSLGCGLHEPGVPGHGPRRGTNSSVTSIQRQPVCGRSSCGSRTRAPRSSICSLGVCSRSVSLPGAVTTRWIGSSRRGRNEVCVPGGRRLFPAPWPSQHQWGVLHRVLECDPLHAGRLGCGQRRVA